MRALVIIFILTLGWLKSNGQTGPVFQYTNPSKQEIYSLATEESPKGYAFRTYLLDVINSGLKDTTLRVSLVNINDVFNNLYFEEIYLEEGKYLNSGYNPSKRKMVPSVGHQWTGFGWVYKIGTFSIKTLKGDCANILSAMPVRSFVLQSSFPPLPKNSEVKTASFNFPEDLGGSAIVTKEQPVQKPWSYEPPVKHKKKFFRRTGVVIGGVVVGVGLGGLVYAILHKKGSSEHGTMSGGRPFVDPANVTIPDPGAGRGD